MEREEHLHAELVFCQGKSPTRPQGVGHCLFKLADKRKKKSSPALYLETWELNPAEEIDHFH